MELSLNAAEYGQCIADLRDLLKTTRRPTSDDSDRVVHQKEGLLRLTQSADAMLNTLVRKLASDIGFEHLSKDELMTALTEFVGDDQRMQVGNPKEVARQFILTTGRSPEEATCYFGVRHLSGLALPIDLGFATLLPREDVTFLQSTFGDEVFRECAVYCKATSVGGTTDKIVERAQRSALSALSLFRLQLRQADRDLTHGSPTGHGPVTVEYEGQKVDIQDPDDLAARCYWWAMDVLSAWTRYVTAYLDRGGASRPRALVADLDRSDAAGNIRKWFLDQGAEDLIHKYAESAVSRSSTWATSSAR
jgi:hypothetical protein